MTQIKNQSTQPINDFRVFNNWNEVANGWYFAMPSKELAIEEVKSLSMCGHELVLFRGMDGKARVLDAYCPHMGTHLGKGKVTGNNVRCFFHHWQFNGEGACIKIPCQDSIPEKARLNHYQIREAYHSIWIYPSQADAPELVDFIGLTQEEELSVQFGKSYERTCHHHVTMINGIDPQHLKTVHDIDLEMQTEISEANHYIDFTLTGDIKSKLPRCLLGPRYSYSMRYDHGNNGFLTIMKDVHFLGYKWPTLHMIFAYRPINKSRLHVQPIFVTKKRKGLLGFLSSQFLLTMTKMSFYSLQSEDGEVYENMRFYPATLLPIDRPVSQFIQYVNKLKISPWKLS
jgi:phenylpropionate dioxygenase-like ring-hydroxylating dioxygenase large terminal subunit